MPLFHSPPPFPISQGAVTCMWADTTLGRNIFLSKVLTVRTIKKWGQVFYRFDLIRTCSYESCIIKSFSIYKYEHKKTEEISVSKRKIRWIVKSLEIPYIVIGTLNNQSYLSKILSELGHPWRKKVHAIWRRLRAWWDVDFD